MPTDEAAAVTARLLFAPELAAGTVRPSQLARTEVRAFSAVHAVPSPVSRAYQRRLLRRGRLGFEATTVPLAMAARHAVLGERAAGPPRLLVRVEGPLEHPAHARLAAAGVPTLVAAPARGLGDAELAGVAEVRRAGGTIALAVPGGDAPKALGEAVDAALAELAVHAVVPEIAVAPAPRWRGWPALASRFAVVCGDPQSVRTFGFHHAPQCRGGAVWLPAWAPFAGLAADALAGARRLAEQGAALWVAVLLQADDPALDAFVDGAREWIVAWDDLLAAMRA